MGKAGASKRNISVTDAGGVETADQHGSPHSQNNVRLVMDKLKALKKTCPEDILKLDSVQTVISALGEQNSSCNKNGCEVDTSAAGDVSLLRKFARGRYLRCNNGRRKSDGVVAETPTGPVTTSSTSRSSIVMAKQGFATLIQNFEHFYKRVAKKYFFMLRPRKPSKSNFFGVFFSILAFIFYYELHTINGFSRLWLKWENVDLSSVEVLIKILSSHYRFDLLLMRI